MHTHWQFIVQSSNCYRIGCHKRKQRPSRTSTRRASLHCHDPRCLICGYREEACAVNREWVENSSKPIGYGQLHNCGLNLIYILFSSRGRTHMRKSTALRWDTSRYLNSKSRDPQNATVHNRSKTNSIYWLLERALRYSTLSLHLRS